jgi:DNA-directed RNA polymerase specialized sigma subunit
MENNLFDLVLLAQKGDTEALHEIIITVLPAIRSARSKIKPDRQDDLEQNIVETIMKKIMSYDLTKAPDFSDFSRQLKEFQLTDNTRNTTD